MNKADKIKKAEQEESARVKKSEMNKVIRKACWEGDLETVKALQSTTDIFAYGVNALDVAAMNGHMALIKYLVSEGGYRYTTVDLAFHRACERSQIEAAQYFLSEGADLHIKDDHILLSSARNGKTEIANFILNTAMLKGFDAFAHERLDEAIRLAATKGNFETLKVFMAHYEWQFGKVYSPWDETNFKKNRSPTAEVLYSPVIGAIDSDNLPMLKYLLEKGVEVSSEDPSALSFAVLKGRLDIVKYYFENHNIAEKDSLLITLCSNEGADLDTLQFIIDQGADIHTCSDAPYRNFCQQDNLSAAKLIFNNDPDYFAEFTIDNPKAVKQQEMMALAQRHLLNRTNGASGQTRRTRISL